MAKFQNRTLLSARGTEKIFNEVPHFHFLDDIGNKIILSDPISIDTKGFSLIGYEQVRLVKINDGTFHMSFTHPSPTSNAGHPIYNTMMTANLNYNKTRRIFELSKPVVMMMKDAPKSLSQKNWVSASGSVKRSYFQILLKVENCKKL